MSLIQKTFESTTAVIVTVSAFSPTREDGFEAKTDTRTTRERQMFIDKAHTAVPQSIRGQAHRIVRRFGTRLETLPVWLVPKARIGELRHELAPLQENWNQWEQELDSNYVSWVDEWCEKHPHEASQISSVAPTLTEVKSACRFAVVELNLSEDMLTDSTSITEEVSGLWGKVLGDIAQDLRIQKMDRSVTYTSATRRILKKMSDKLMGLGFLHPRLEEAAQGIDKVVAGLPHSGSIKGLEALAVKGLVDALIDPVTFAKYGFGAATLAVVKDDLGGHSVLGYQAEDEDEEEFVAVTTATDNFSPQAVEFEEMSVMPIIDSPMTFQGW